MKTRKALLAVACASLAAALAEIVLLDLPLAQGALLFFATLFVPPAAAYAWFDYAASRRVADIDEALPSALFQVASLPRGTSTEKMIAAVASAGYGALSKEFSKANRRIGAGASVPRALELTAQENDSALLKRSCLLLSNAYAAGGDQSHAFKEVAEDAFQMQALARENAASLSVQKYTLLAASALLVPAILALLLNIVSTLSAGLDSGGLLLSSASASQRAALLAAVTLGNQAYLALFAALSAYFVASFEGNAKKAVVYAAFNLPCALLLFEFLRQAGIA